MVIKKPFLILPVCAALMLFCACQQEEETRLRLQLSSSLNLSQYDSIEVALVDTGSDTSTVLTRLFVGPLDSLPSSWPLPANLRDGQFAVRVRAYRFEGQLGMQFYLVKESGGRQGVTLSTVPNPVPYSRALQTLGAQSGFATPAFDTAAADTNYQVWFPHNADTAKISPAPVDSRAQIFIGDNSAPLASGDTVRVPLDSGMFVPLKITVQNHGAKRCYHLSLGRDSVVNLDSP